MQSLLSVADVDAWGWGSCDAMALQVEEFGVVRAIRVFWVEPQVIDSSSASITIVEYCRQTGTGSTASIIFDIGTHR